MEIRNGNTTTCVCRIYHRRRLSLLAITRPAQHSMAQWHEVILPVSLRDATITVQCAIEWVPKMNVDAERMEKSADDYFIKRQKYVSMIKAGR